jgi:hypothetical protein
VKQFLSHLDLEMLFQNVPTLCHLDMTYGVKSIGMDYERTLFGEPPRRPSLAGTLTAAPSHLPSSSLPTPLRRDGTSRATAPRPRRWSQRRPSIHLDRAPPPLCFWQA